MSCDWNKNRIGRTQHLARWAVASALGLSAACDTVPAALDATIGPPDAGDASAPPEFDWIAADCSNGPSPRVLAHVGFTRKLDHAAFFSSFPGGTLAALGAFPAGTQQLDAVGVACATSRSPMVCAATMDALRAPSDECVAERTCTPFLLTVQGDKVTRVDEQSELLALLGTIDSEPKAELVAMFNGHTLACPASTGSLYLRGTQVRADADGYEVRTEWQVCNAPAISERLHVDTDATLIALDNQIVGPKTCFSGP